MRKPSIRNFKFLNKAKSKTWAPSHSQPQTDTTELQDTEPEHVPESQPELLALPYEESSLPSEEPAGPKNPYAYHRIATSLLPLPAVVKNETGRDEASTLHSSATVQSPKSPSTIITPKSPEPKRVNSITKMTSFLRLKKAKTELTDTSPSLEQISEPAEESTDESPLTIDRGSTVVAQTLPISPTSSTLTPHTATFTTFTSASSDPDARPTPFPALDTDPPLDSEPDLTAVKQEIRSFKLADVHCTRTALSLAHSAREIGLSTLSRLRTQNERLANTDIHIHEAGVQNRIASQQIRTLKRARRFLPVVGNPFTAGRRGRQGDEAALAVHRREREQRDALRWARWEEAFRRRVTVTVALPAEDGKLARLVERAKYQFEPDSEDDLFEGEIEGNLDRLVEVAPQLREIAVEMGRAVEEGTRRLEGMMERMDAVDDGLVRNRHALGRVH